MRYTCKLLQDQFNSLADANKKVSVYGHCKTIRDSKRILFIELNDGTTLNNVQLVFFKNENKLPVLTVNTVISVIGSIKKTPKRQQSFEIIVDKLTVLNKAAHDTYPLQKKNQTLEYLRTIQEYRLATSIMQNTHKVKQLIITSLMDYLNKENYMWVHTPVLTTNDSEGGGEVFVVDDKKTFFSQKTYLTVSGQLNAEIAAQSFHKVYTFGPTFRAEKSNTPFHVAEFWMLEPEITFFEINDLIKEIKKTLSFVGKSLLNSNMNTIEYLSNINNVNLVSRIKQLIKQDYAEVTYTDAQKLLKNTKDISFKNKNFDFGTPLQREHEQYLCTYFKKPVVIKHYPLETSSFYMYDNGDGTVRNFDIVFENIGELIGGSQREDRYDLLKKQIIKKSSLKALQWYLDLRKHGYAKSSGYGLGIERLIMYLTGTKNIRDVQLFPRAYKQISL